MEAITSIVLELQGVDPLALYSSIGNTSGPTLYYEASKLGQVHIFADSLLQLEASQDRFVKAAQFVEDFYLAFQPSKSPARPIIPFTFNFEEETCQTSPALIMFIPRWHFFKSREQSYIQFFCFVKDKDSPLFLEYVQSQLKVIKALHPYKAKNHAWSYNVVNSYLENYPNRVDLAIRDIQEEKYSKITLATYVDYEVSQNFCILDWIFKKRQDFPTSTIFCFRKNGSSFFGASPEVLLYTQGNTLYTEALAGSIPRQECPIKSNNAILKLLQDPKCLQEHWWVRDAIEKELNAFGLTPIFSPEPSVISLKHIHHLHTAITCSIPAGFHKTVLGLIAALHPTPALGSFPQRAYVDHLKSLEGFSRGLYGGGTGFIGEKSSFVSVNIRCGLLQKGVLRAYAGCGITGASIPSEELLEAQTKMKSIL